MIRQLIEGKTPKVLAALPDGGEEWAIHFAFLARAGFTEAAQAEAKRHGAMLVDLQRSTTICALCKVCVTR